MCLLWSSRLALVCPAAVDLTLFVVVDSVVDALTLLLTPADVCPLVGCWRMLCRHCRWPPLLQMLCCRE